VPRPGALTAQENAWSVLSEETEQQSTVYVVDPDPAVRDSLKSLLGILGYGVETYLDAEAFLAAADVNGRGCLVTEAHLPGMSGVELQEKLRELDSALPVILIAGRGDIQLAVRALRLGAVDFLEKPFVDRILIRRIEQVLPRNDRDVGAATEE
jgi:FixJ family two-component response regulator